MKVNLERSIKIPEGIKFEISGSIIKAQGKGKENVKEFDVYNLEITVEENHIKIGAKNATRRESKMIGTIWAHLNNMIKGILDDFVYKMEICNVHFPMNVKVEGNKVVIKSFLGETTKRIARIMPNSKVEIKGTEITITSYDIESAGQTAANIEKATKLTGRDRRIFQDGIFITNKGGREI